MIEILEVVSVLVAITTIISIWMQQIVFVSNNVMILMEYVLEMEMSNTICAYVLKFA